MRCLKWYLHFVSNYCRLKSKELSLQLDRARRQVTELETRLAQKEVEFETYKGRSDTHMESQLQAELGLLKLEKVGSYE